VPLSVGRQPRLPLTHVPGVRDGGPTDTFGQLGVGAGVTQSATEKNVTLSRVTFVSAGYLYTCAVASGAAYCWGLSAFGSDRVS